MGNRICKLSESPCYQCGVQQMCYHLMHVTEYKNIKDQIFGNKDFNYINCPLYIAITGPKY